MIDIVLPKDNEEEFIDIASKLGIKKLYFIYNFDDYKKEITQRKPNQNAVDIEIGFLVNQKNFKNASKQSNFLMAKSSDKDRYFIESKKIKLIYGFEELPRKDYLHQRASGLNHVLCELAKKNGVAIGISYSSLINKNQEYASLLMGRMMQNIKLCQKHKTKIMIGSFSDNPFHLRNSHDVTNLFVILGMGNKNNSLLIRNS